MNFQTSVKTCFKKYATFSGRASRSEFWWFLLFVQGSSVVLQGLDTVSFGGGMNAVPLFSSIFTLAVLLPSLAVWVRRLHDRNKSAWALLLWLIPVVGWIILLVWVASAGDAEDNRFGPAPDTSKSNPKAIADPVDVSPDQPEDPPTVRRS